MVPSQTFQNKGIVSKKVSNFQLTYSCCKITSFFLYGCQVSGRDTDKTSLIIFFKQKSPFSSGDISIDYNLTLLYTNFEGRFHT